MSDGPDAARSAAIKRYRSNFRDEVDGVALYERLADAEKDPAIKHVYQRLSQVEAKHLALWARKLEEAGEKLPPRRPSLRIRVLGFLARRFGTNVVAPIVRRMEVDATTMYDDQPEAVAEGLPGDERSHARMLQAITTGPSSDPVADIARLEGRHRGGTGNALRAAVLGVNDGLVSNLSLVMGVAGTDPGRDPVIVAGMLGLLAGALSMALGEWISVRSSTEAFERQLAIERDELMESPEEEEEELTIIYQAKGLSPEEARRTAHRIIQNPATALDTLAREELGMAPGEAGSPMVAAVTSFFLFAAGALLPVLPWFFVGGAVGVVSGAALAGVGLFLTGAGITLFTGRSILYSGTRQLAFGLVCAAITFGLGFVASEVFGVSISG
jgi:vacuolar iron transporter family protein